MPIEVVLLVGLPAAGKSTFFRERLAGTHVHVSKDNFPNHRQPSKRQERELRDALEIGSSVAVDNTNASPEERAVVIKVAQEFGVPVVGYVFEFDVAGSRERNEGRLGAARVPVVAIYSAAKRYREPSMDEGFSDLRRVRLTETGFDVQRWEEG